MTRTSSTDRTESIEPSSSPVNPKKLDIASSARTWSCAGPGTASTSVPEAPDECVRRCFSRGCRICR
eukprot:8334300-Alexandrium_andersonii.AAC.1